MLKLHKSISYSSTNKFPQLLLDYIAGNSELRQFYNYLPTIDGFKEAIEDRSNFEQAKRDILVQHLLNQYSKIELDETVSHNIESLRQSKTFTVTTGHQLNLFTGPLYFIYKVLTVIKLAKRLKDEFPDENFVPVYWMASEDHDFEEIQFFNFQNKKYTWNSDQEGAVGEFSLNGFQDFIKDTPLRNSQLTRFYENSENLSEAHLKLVDHLFRDYGLVVLDANSKVLKEQFASVVKRDCDSDITFNHIGESSKLLQEKGYSTQVNSRELNYFILNKQSRLRLERNNRGYFTRDEQGNITEIDLDQVLQSNPERISPNVITRPIFQETILPNLAYSGGPAEMTYWMQMKSSFDALLVNYPVLMPRLTATILSSKALEKFKKCGLENIEDIFKNERELLKTVMIRKGLLKIDEHLEWEDKLNDLFDNISKEVSAIDSTLGPSAEGRRKKVLKELSKIRKKMESAVIRNQGVYKDRIYAIKEEVFPNNSFQERFINVTELLAQTPDFIQNLEEDFGDPLEFTHSVFVQD